MSEDYDRARREALAASTQDDRERRVESEIYARIATWAVDQHKAHPTQLKYHWNAVGSVLTVTFSCGEEKFTATSDRGAFWIDPR
jgi:hypothetical protein